MILGFGHGLGFGGRVPLPTPYTTVETAGVASQAVEVDNGMYDVLVEGATKEWKRVFVASGSYTVTPANADATWTRARFYGPYGLTPNTGDAVGSALVYGAVFNSEGAHASYGHTTATSDRLAVQTSSPNIWQSHQGWCASEDYYYSVHTNRIDRRSRTDWSVLAQNATPFAGLTGTPNHMGGCAYHDGRVYVAVTNWSGACGASHSQQVAVYDAVTLALVETHSIAAALGSGEASGVAVDADSGLVYVSSYCAAEVFVFDLVTFDYVRTVSYTGARLVQDVAVRDGKLYLSGARTTTNNVFPIVLEIDTAGRVLREFLLLSSYFGIEGVNFDVDGQLGVLMDDSASVSKVEFYTVPAAPANWTKGGFLAAKDRSLWPVGRTIPADYAVLMRYTPTSIYNWNSLWDNAQDGSSNEAWINSTGVLNARANASDTAATAALAVAGAAMTIGWCWNNATKARALYVNNADRVTTVAANAQTNSSGNDIYLLSGHSQNTLADGLLNYTYVFSRSLTLAEKQALEADPGRIWSPTNALTQAQKDALAA